MYDSFKGFLQHVRNGMPILLRPPVELEKRLRGGGRRRRKDRNLISASPLFDLHWYLEAHPDVASEGVDAALHFLETGWLEGRDPGPEFSTNAYLRANPDVGRAGINPLLHFIEFGQFEGREIRGRQFPRWRETTVAHDYGPAAPVFRGSIEQKASSPWRSWHRLSRDDDRLFSIGEWSVCYVDRARRGALESAFGYLRDLSGYPAHAESATAYQIDEYGSASLVDAWFVNEATLRTRWRDAQFPFVVRAFQHDNSRDGQVALVADEVVISTLDIVDMSVRDCYSPILLVFANPDGRARGIRLLAFPSLCRGGLHYPELLAASGQGQSPDPMAIGRERAERLLIARRASGRCVNAISVDPRDADGTSPLVQPQFARWLERVAGVEIQTSPMRESAGTLVLAPDMIPTIDVLAGSGGADESADMAFLGLLIAHPDPSEPALSVQVPPRAPQALALAAPGYAVAWPRLSGSCSAVPADGQVGAIRLLDERKLTDAELLIPAMNDPVPVASEQRVSITWIIDATGLSFADLTNSARALSLYSDDSTYVIGFVGQADPEACEAVAKLVRGRLRTYANLVDAVQSADTDFIGYLGRGVILHDPRACGVLVSMLQDSAAASAACVLVAAEIHGKAWHVSVVDAGKISTEGRHPASDDVQQFWRSCYSVERPPRDFWLARTATAKKWFGSTPPVHLESGMHLCTSLVTASRSRDPRQGSANAEPPPAPADRVTRIKALFG